MDAASQPPRFNPPDTCLNVNPDLEVTDWGQSTSPFVAIAQEIEQHPHRLRLKKLLICLCYRHWELDGAKVNTWDCQALLEELWRSPPTPTQLSERLQAIVRSLTKPVEYGAVAQVLLAKLRRLDPGYHPLSQHLAQQVADAIAQDPESERMWKLLFCICRNTWENDLSRLCQWTLTRLVTELWELSPTREQLQPLLEQVIQTLSKPDKYRLVGQTLQHHLSPLYTTQTTVTQPAISTVSPRPMAAVPLTPTAVALPSILSAPAVAASGAAAPSLARAPQNRPERPQPNWFEVRLAVIKYANPLRAKQILFSVLYQPLGLTGHDLSTLRLYALVELLQQLFETYADFGVLEAQLAQIAKSLTDPTTSLPTAQAIARALHPFYPHANPVSAHLFATTQARWRNQSQDGEETAQFFDRSEPTGCGLPPSPPES